MRYSRISWLFLIFLATSLGLKVTMQNQPMPLDPAALKYALAKEFGGNDYTVSFGPRSWGVIATAQKFDCRMLVLQRPYDGAYKDRIGQLAKPFGPLRHVYRGRISVEPPSWEAFIRDRIVNQLQQFGLRAGRSPVLAVAASPGCSLEEINWSRLALFYT